MNYCYFMKILNEVIFFVIDIFVRYFDKCWKLNVYCKCKLCYILAYKNKEGNRNVCAVICIMYIAYKSPIITLGTSNYPFMQSLVDARTSRIARSERVGQRPTRT